MSHAASLGVEADDAARPTLPDALARLPGHLLWRAAARVDLALDRLLPEGVDIHAYAVLVTLGDGRPRSQQALADSTGVSRTTMVRVADALASAGLVERVRNPDDRRSYLLTRTPTGTDAARDWQDHAEALEDALTSGFTTRERRDLRTLMLRLADDWLDAHTPEPLTGSLGFLVTRVHARLHRDFAEQLRPWGIMPRDVGALTLLLAGPVVQGELGRMLGISGPTAVQIVDSLEERGLVERRRSATDRRSQVLHLLPRGREVQEAVKGRADVRRGFGPLDLEETDRLCALLGRFVTSPLS